MPLVLSQDPPGLRVRQRALGLPDLRVQLDLPGRLGLRGQLVLRVFRALPGHKAIWVLLVLLVLLLALLAQLVLLVQLVLLALLVLLVRLLAPLALLGLLELLVLMGQLVPLVRLGLAVPLGQLAQLVRKALPLQLLAQLDQLVPPGLPLLLPDLQVLEDPPDPQVHQVPTQQRCQRYSCWGECESCRLHNR